MKTEYFCKGLPHFHHIGATFAITTQLYDAIPQQVLTQLRNDYEQSLANIEVDCLPDKPLRKYKVQCSYETKFEELLHAKSHQEHLLTNPFAAQIVADKIKEFDGQLYECCAYTILSNHIHLLLDFSEQLLTNYDGVSDILNYVNLDMVMKRIKGGTATPINRVFGREGSVWRKGYYNRYIRNQQHFTEAYYYVINNPVKAKKVSHWRKHPFTYGGKLAEMDDVG